MGETRRFVIDTDTASDDAVAILMALRWPDVQVDAITTVSGNVPVEMGTRNALYTAELCGADTPVYEGLARPLTREPHYAYFFHGPDGMGSMDYPEPKKGPEDKHAVDALIEVFGESPGEVTLVTLGPLSNVATALRIEPRLAGWVEKCYIMGGAACTVGNITPAAEYNIWCDPEAARIVFHSGMKIMMVGWELCRGDANLDEDDMRYVRGIGTPYAHFTIDCNTTAINTNREWLGDPALALPDPVTMAIALDPAVDVRSDMYYVDVECDSETTRGMTVVDELGVTDKEPNIEVCREIDVPLWKETLYKTLR